MKFVCGKHDCPGLSGRAACEKCGLTLTVGGLFRYAVSSVWSFARRAFAVSCPRCHTLIPAFQNTCRFCGNTITVQQAFEETIGPHRESMKELVAPTSKKKRIFQWAYLAASVLLFWWMLGRLESQYSTDWEKHAGLSALYLAVFLLISLWIIPQKTLIVIAHRASKIIKLGLVFNYLAALLFLQIFLATWWARSFMLAVLFVTTWAGAWLFWRFLWPMAGVVSNIFASPDPNFDPRGPQGRNVRMD